MMKGTFLAVFLLLGVTMEIFAVDNLLEKNSNEIYDLLKTPSDSLLQSDIKAIIAKYLVESTLSDEGTEVSGRFESPVPFGRHKHRDRYDELLQKLQEQQLQQQKLQEQLLLQQKLAAAVALPPQPSGIVPSSQPVAIAPSQPTAPIPSQEAKQEPIVQNPVAPPSVNTVPPVQKQEVVTQVPIILETTLSSQPVSPPLASQPIVTESTVAASGTTTTLTPVTLRPTVDPVHHLNQVNKILGNVANGNIVGIVDESLAIRAPAPVRQLVTNIMKVIFCNPIDRLFGRCAPNQIDAAKNSEKGR